MSSSEEMRAAVLVNPGKDFSFEIQSVPKPSYGPNDILVELEVTSVCGSDLFLANGLMGPTKPVLGHEGIGRIAAVGSACSPNVKPGQQVGVGWLRDACRECDLCLGGDETRCETKTYSGRDVSGTFARYTVVPERYVLPVAEDVPPESLAPILCGGVTAYKALKSCGAVPGSWVGVFGAVGGVGALAVQYARAMGYRPIGIDTGGESAAKVCKELGAEVFVDFMVEKDVSEAIKRQTGGNLCSAIIVAAGSPAAYETALTCLAYYSTLVCVGIPAPTATMKLHPVAIIDKGIRIIGSLIGSRVEVGEAIEFVRRGLVQPKTVSVKMSEMNEYVMKMNTLNAKIVVRLEG